MTGLEIAVIGMAGRFPGARDIAAFWDNLKNGVESLAFFSDDELHAAGVEPGITGNPGYVKSHGILADIEYFDPAFFNYTRKEAEVMDPQMRIFHECAWEALENAGYDPGAYPGPIGLYGGTSSGFNWEAALTLSGQSRIFGFGASQLTRKDMTCLRVSYRLNLQGPAITLYTGCSTSLTAIHLACQALLSGECDMALAGGVAVSVPQINGYLYQEGMIFSRDGHCRAFDARATGTNGGNGAAVVVLKRLDDALADSDYIYALIKGSAMNNDGSRKVGFTAPSIKGQVEVIQAALGVAGIEPESIGYIETHGTGTILGDPIEMKALIQAIPGEKEKICAIGSLKTNVGHMDAAAGAAGLIKAVLILKHRFIPPSLNFESPNPDLEIENSPFYVNTEPREWKRDGYPRRAGVSSFGIGGTNVHVVLEEAPEAGAREKVEEDGMETPAEHMVVLSARTPSALARLTENTARYLGENPGIRLADAAFTLLAGRKAFPHRRVVVGATVPQVGERLSSLPQPSEAVQTFYTGEENRPVIFMFPGQGAQYTRMGEGIYRREPVFRDEMDRCFTLLEPLLGYDLKEILYPGLSSSRFGQPGRSGSSAPPDNAAIHRTEITQPVLFMFEYALARLLMRWGIVPAAMIGHSIGEYVAACLAGVFSLEDALEIVALRGKLMQQMPPGAMLSVSLSREQLRPLLPDRGEISLAAVNSPSHCVVSGPSGAITDFAALLKEKGVESKILHTSHAFHSGMMEPILDVFSRHLAQVNFNAPNLPFISNLTGKAITGKEAVDPAYWVSHLRETVRFSRGISLLLAEKKAVFLEVGPGRTLTSLVKQHQEEDNPEDRCAVNLIRHPRETVSDTGYLLTKLGQLWGNGVKIHGPALYARRPKQRIPLPAYSFDRIRCWPGDHLFTPGKRKGRGQDSLFQINDMTQWFYVPSWERSPLLGPDSPAKVPGRWLVFVDGTGFGRRLLERLAEEGKEVITVSWGEAFNGPPESGGPLGSRYTLNPRQGQHYRQLFRALAEQEKIPSAIVHLWGLTAAAPGIPGEEPLENHVTAGFSSLIHVARAIAAECNTTPIRIGVVTDNVQSVTGEERLNPAKATVLAPVKLIPLEYANLTCQSIDLVLPRAGSRQEDRLIGLLVQEFNAAPTGQAIAYRGMHRWVETFRGIRLERPEPGHPGPLPVEEPVCLVCGEAGDTLLAVVEYLVKRVKARVILILSPDSAGEEYRGKLRDMENSGASLEILRNDTPDDRHLESLLAGIKKRYDRLHGLFHLPGPIPGAGTIQEISPTAGAAHLIAGIKRVVLLDRLLKEMNLEPGVVVSFSSLGAAVYPSQKGRVTPCAAWEFLDAFSYHRASLGRPRALTLGNWLEPLQLPADWGDMLNPLLQTGQPRILVSPVDLENLIRHYDQYKAMQYPQKPGEDGEDPDLTAEPTENQRQGLSSPYVSPRTSTEEYLARIWQRFFALAKIGIDDDFFQLGGDSLQAMMLLNTLRQRMQIEISLDFFFSNPTIRGLAGYIQHQSRDVEYAACRPVEKKEYYPLSPFQETILAVHRMNPGSVTYNISFAVELAFNTDKNRVADVFAKLIEKHESLRTSFPSVKGVIRQRVHHERDLAFEIEDLEAAANPGESRDRILKRFIRTFDLDRAPLLRVGLMKTGQTADTRYILVLDLHHIVADGASGNIIIKSLKALARGEDLPCLKLHYKDYAEWYRHRLEAGVIDRQEKYWVKQFETKIPLLNLPTDYDRPAQKSYEGDFIPFEIDQDKVDRVRAFALRENVTLMMVFISIYYIFLSRLSGNEDIVIAVPVNGRNQRDMEQMIGMLVKTIYLRNFPSREKGYVEFLKEVRSRVLEAYENQDYPPDSLIGRIALNRDPGRNPVTDAGFSLVQIEETRMKTSSPERGPQVSPYNLGRSDMVVMDISLMVIEKGKRISFKFAYLKKLFKRETMERFAGYYKHILDIVLENHDILLKDLRVSHDLVEAEPNVKEIDFDL